MIDLERWPALVLAAGLATRLRPLSTARAKAALPVAGRSLIVRILERLQDAGVRRVVINLHHQPATITSIVGDGSSLGLEVRYSWERQALGSAGGPARAIPLLAADRFLIVNGDTLSDVDFAALADAHVRSRAAATMAVAPADLTKYNAILADDAGRVTGFARRGTKAEGHAFHFVGVQAVDARAFAGVATDVPSETVRELYPRLIAGQAGSVGVLAASAHFDDIGTPRDYFETAHRLAAREGHLLAPGRLSRVDPTATVAGSIIWDRVTIGAGATVTDCVVADDVAIAAGAHYHRQVITPGEVVAL